MKRWVKWTALLALGGIIVSGTLVSVRVPETTAGGFQCLVDTTRAAWSDMIHARSGVTRALVAFVRFSDDTIDCTCSEGWPESLEVSQLPAWADSFIDPPDAESWTEGSLSHFFWQMSGGGFVLCGDLYESVVVPPHTYEYYDTTYLGYNLCLSAVNHDVLDILDADTSIHFSDYDTNPANDTLDALLLVYRRVPKVALFGGWSALFDQHGALSDTVDGSILVDGRLGGSGAMLTGLNLFDARTVGAHEYTHLLLGADEPGMTSDGHWSELDRFGLMPMGQDGGTSMSAFERLWLGWVEPEIVSTTSYGVEIGDMLSTGDVYVVPIPNEEIPGTALEEYFLLESRQHVSCYEQISEDTVCHWSMPATGLLITHVLIDDPEIKNKKKVLDFECADGAYDDDTQEPDPVCGIDWLEWRVPHRLWVRRGGGHADSSDTYNEENGTALAPYTVPNTNFYLYDFSDTCDDWPTRLRQPDSTAIGIINIATQAGSTMTFDVLFDMGLGRVCTTTTWSGLVILDGDVTVDPGDTLTISPGTTVRLADNTDRREGGLDAERVELIIEGTFVAEGDSTDFIRFLPDSCNWAHEDYDTQVPAPGDWFGIVVRDGGEAHLEYCELGYAMEAVRVDSAGTVTIKHCEVHHDSLCGVAVYRDGTATIDSSEVSYAGCGVKVDSAATVVVGSSSIHHNSEAGIWIRGASPKVLGCQISGNDAFGMYVVSTDSARVRTCVLDGDPCQARCSLSPDPRTKMSPFRRLCVLTWFDMGQVLQFV